MWIQQQQIEQDIAAAKQMAASIDAKQILSLIDLTSLNVSDTSETIAEFCKNAHSSFGNVAALCVFPAFITQVKRDLKQLPIKVATVANFPSGAQSLEIVMEEIYQAVQAGADEVDVVFPYPMYLQGNKIGAYDFIRACKTACGHSAQLKVILETGALIDLAIIAEVSHNVCLTGADFLKTSSGKVETGATLEAAWVMLHTIRELSQKLKRSIGFKVSGGVRTLQQAGEYIALAQTIMTPEWATAEHFRIGASQLVSQAFESIISREAAVKTPDQMGSCESQ